MHGQQNIKIYVKDYIRLISFVITKLYRIQRVTIKHVNFEALILSIVVLFIFSVCHIELSSAVAGSSTVCCLESAWWHTSCTNTSEWNATERTAVTSTGCFNNLQLRDITLRNCIAILVSELGSITTNSLKTSPILKIYLNPYPLTWKIWWAPNNASKWQMGFNSAFKGLILLLIVPLFSIVRKIAKKTISFFMFVRPSVCLSVCAHGTTRLSLGEFLWNLVLEVFFRLNLSRNFKFHKNLTRIPATLYEDQYTFMIVCGLILLRMRNVSDTICRVYQNMCFTWRPIYIYEYFF
jgi:hypothetical protein